MSRTLSTLCMLVVATASAMADPAAEQLFRDGRQLLKDGKIDDACEKFQQSRAVEPKTGTSLNLADCRERQGKLATAWELFLETKALAARQNDSVVVAEATKRAAAIEGKRAFLVIVVPPDHRVPNMNVRRNDTVIEPATWDLALPIDPGTYVVDTNAAGYDFAPVRVDVAPGGRATATVPAPTKLAVARPVEPVQPPLDVHRRPEPAPKLPVDPPIRTGALGVALGGTSNGDFTPGFRLIAGLRAIAQIEAGPGALRAVITFLYNRRYNDTSYAGDNSNGFAFGLGGDYLFAWKPGLASALGIGVGFEVFQGGDFDTDVRFRKTVRVSPIIVRFQQRPIELGLHAVIMVEDSPILIATAGVDWFIW